MLWPGRERGCPGTPRGAGVDHDRTAARKALHGPLLRSGSQPPRASGDPAGLPAGCSGRARLHPAHRGPGPAPPRSHVGPLPLAPDGGALRRGRRRRCSCAPGPRPGAASRAAASSRSWARRERSSPAPRPPGWCSIWSVAARCGWPISCLPTRWIRAAQSPTISCRCRARNRPGGSVSFRVRQSDLDMNRHVNNAVYVGWALEAAPEDVAQSRRPVDIEVGYPGRGPGRRHGSRPLRPGSGCRRRPLPARDHPAGGRHGAGAAARQVGLSGPVPAHSLPSSPASSRSQCSRIRRERRRRTAMAARKSRVISSQKAVSLVSAGTQA